MKNIFLFLCLISSVSTYSSIISLSNGEKIDLNTVDGRIHFEYYKKLSELEEKISTCANSDVVINKPEIEFIAKNWDYLSTAFIYFDAKTQYECSKEKIKAFTLTSTLLQSLNEEINEKI